MSITVNGTKITHVYSNGGSNPCTVYSNSGTQVHPDFSGFDGTDSRCDYSGIIRGVDSNVGYQLVGYHEFGYPESAIYITASGDFTDGYLLTRDSTSNYRVFEINVTNNVFKIRSFFSDVARPWSATLTFDPLTGFENKAIVDAYAGYGIESDGGFRFRFTHYTVDGAWINLVRA